MGSLIAKLQTCTDESLFILRGEGTISCTGKGASGQLGEGTIVIPPLCGIPRAEILRGGRSFPKTTLCCFDLSVQNIAWSIFSFQISGLTSGCGKSGVVHRVCPRHSFRTSTVSPLMRYRPQYTQMIPALIRNREVSSSLCSVYSTRDQCTIAKFNHSHGHVEVEFSAQQIGAMRSIQDNSNISRESWLILGPRVSIPAGVIIR